MILWNIRYLLSLSSSETFLPSFYIPLDRDSFVCSPSHGNGMTKCSDIPRQRQGNRTCDLDVNSNGNVSDGCINWYQYYQRCQPSTQNPYGNSISFDHIGMAWIVIFQVEIEWFEGEKG